MCFSPTASFTASAVLGLTGIITLRKTKTKKELFLASVPLIFALQQLIEGFLWLSLLQSVPSEEGYWLTQIFVAIAGMVWPIFIPLSILMLEPHKMRQRGMWAVLAVGIGVAIYTLEMMRISGASARIVNSCILYEHPVEQTKTLLAFYIIATCSAFFLSSHRMMICMGIINLAGFAAAYYFYNVNFISVWCFFGALASATIYSYFNHFHFRLRLRKDRRFFSHIYAWLKIP